MTHLPPIPPHLARHDWYAPHLAWLASQGLPTRHAVPDGTAAKRAYLRGASLWGAYLQNADLQNADLQNADLQGAYLRGASLWGAYLQNADLQDADLQGAYLRGAAGITSVGPVGAERRIIYDVRHVDCIMVQAGCSWATLDETRAAVLDRYADGTGREQHRAGYLAALDAIAAILGAT